MIGTGFLAFMLLTSNPFLRLDPAPLDGEGLNPILQDIGLAIHPPMLYLGYVGLSTAYSFAVAALLEGRIDATWARWVRPWTLAAWMSLTLGIALGSYWAYYELGWGGWWFWDPVENASFMPWLAATALLHSAIVVEKRDALKSWTILLAILAFSLSLLGTFLVRSGVLTSVHAFATDPARGVFILALLVVAIGGSLALYAWRAPAMQGGGLFAPISREGGLVLNNLLLATACATVLLGTLYPLILDTVGGPKISVGAPFFNATFVPLMVPLAIAVPFGSMLAWKRGDLPGVLGRLWAAFAVTALATVLYLVLVDARHTLAAAGVALGAWVVAGSLNELAQRVGLFRVPAVQALVRVRNLPRSAWSMTTAHIGLGILILGITVSSTGREEQILALRPGETADLAGYTIRFEGERDVQGPNYVAQQGEFTVSRNGGCRDAADLREALLPGRAHADDRGRHRHRPLPRPLPRPGRSLAGRELDGPPLLQPARGLDLGRGRHHGAGRPDLAHRPPPARGSAPPGARPPAGPGGSLSLGDRHRSPAAPPPRPPLPHPARAVRGDRRLSWRWASPAIPARCHRP